MAEAMDGNIDVESRSGIGTTFHVIVRLRFLDVQDLDPAAGTLTGLSVLMATKHARTGRVIARQLLAAGCHVVTVDPAQHSLEVYQRSLTDGMPPTVAIIDQQLSDGNGAWLATQIRAFDAPPPGMILLRKL